MQYNKRCKKALISEHGSRHWEKHYNAIAVEGLDSREAVAGELAVRDFKVEYLEYKLLQLNGELVYNAIMQDMPQCLEE